MYPQQLTPIDHFICYRHLNVSEARLPRLFRFGWLGRSAVGPKSKRSTLGRSKSKVHAFASSTVQAARVHSAHTIREKKSSKPASQPSSHLFNMLICLFVCVRYKGIYKWMNTYNMRIYCRGTMYTFHNYEYMTLVLGVIACTIRPFMPYVILLLFVGIDAITSVNIEFIIWPNGICIFTLDMRVLRATEMYAPACEFMLVCRSRIHSCIYSHDFLANTYNIYDIYVHVHRIYSLAGGILLL